MGSSSSRSEKNNPPPSSPTNTSQQLPLQPRLATNANASASTPYFTNNSTTATVTNSTSAQLGHKTSTAYGSSTSTSTSSSHGSTSCSPLSRSHPVTPTAASQEVKNLANNYVIPAAVPRKPVAITPCQDKSYEKLMVCPQYNGRGCVAQPCRRLHVCFDWAVNNCKSITCKYDHSLNTLHNKRLFKACRPSDSGQPELSRVLKIEIRTLLDENPQICMDNILKRCTEEACPRIHSAKNYRWEVKDDIGWTQLAYHQSNYLELLYSHPSVDCVELIPLQTPLPNSRVLRRLNNLLSKETSWSVHFETMKLKGLSLVHDIRRLSTPSDVISNEPEATRWIWYWKDDRCWKPYSEGTVLHTYHVALSDCLEYLFRVYNYEIITVETGSYHYKIDGGNMTQTNVITGKVRRVRRRPVCSLIKHESVKFDELFLPFTTSKKYLRVQVVPLSSEFVHVKKLLKQTLPRVRVISIHRVQNDHLWKVYQTKKRLLVSLYNGDAEAVNEQYLFHGTKHEVIDAICEENLDWKLSGTNVGQLYGCGTYFSNMAWMAHQYAQSDETGSRVMLVVLVLVGKMTRGYEDMTLPPTNVSTGRTFDTTCNNDTDATVFVKYNRDEYYPAYVVRYRCDGVTFP